MNAYFQFCFNADVVSFLVPISARADDDLIAKNERSMKRGTVKTVP